MDQTLITQSSHTGGQGVGRINATHSAAPSRLEAVWARHEEDVAQAQQLRFRVFAEEMGARLQLPAGTPAGHDADRFDAYCEHLLVRTVATPHEPARVVGTYRVLTPEAARRAGGLYSEQEFDLARLQPLRPQMAELGRSCIDSQWRTGGAILLLWSMLAEFMQRNRFAFVIGCASIPVQDGGHWAASLWSRLRDSHLASEQYAVTPHLPLPVEELRCDLAAEPPPLIRGYLRCGGKLLGAPAWDPDFNTADMPMMLRLQDLPASYRKRFIGN